MATLLEQAYAREREREEAATKIDEHTYGFIKQEVRRAVIGNHWLPDKKIGTHIPLTQCSDAVRVVPIAVERMRADPYYAGLVFKVESVRGNDDDVRVPITITLADEKD